MRVVAEGVETSRQADLLEGFDCDELQGFLIAEPMASGEIDAFLAVHRGLTLKLRSRRGLMARSRG
jgi:EAL domain-containing protein (putative c-di-GMP-specific phosphodiesterase class I)